MSKGAFYDQCIYKDKDGQKKVVYEVNADGTVTVYDENDQMYKNYVAGQKWSKVASGYQAELERKAAEREKRAEQARLQRIQSIRVARKRHPSDPIYVLVHRTEIEAEDQKSAKETAKRVHQFVIEQVSNDRIIKTTNKKPDVEVFSKIYFKQGLGYDKKKGKPVAVPLFYFEFTVRSSYYPEDNYTFEEHGHWMKNQQIVQQATERIKKIIKNMIGPNIPAERYKYL